MLRTVYIELLKIKRSKLILFILACTMVNAFISYIVEQNAVTMGSLLQSTVTRFNLLLGAPLFAIVTGFIVADEYRHQVVDQLFTYPISRAKILLGKLLFLLSLVLLGVISSFLFTVVVGIATGASSVTGMFDYILPYLVTAGTQMALVPIVMMISIIGRSIIGGIAVGVIAGFSSGLVTAIGLGMYYPWSIPTVMTYDILGILDADLVKTLTSLFIIFVVPLALSFIFYKKMFKKNCWFTL
ncbi:ABC transporter permease [Virgibacillus sp. NKC19-3]|uniref:ABC transporter permease n=1 Tax=Virgibacillus saliphilus TaxID=2831674 RepID=UPI001C9ADBB0|nr:ABC transporter permease [Virgibacillus sp. NKC19-3]MBY7142549.1 ABC transporter permease [Virgibacillus sp. NKC19-3]